MLAGAGSGKTRSLVGVLQRLQSESRRHFVLGGQQVGVITYTNAACDEINRRLAFDPIFHVATIHSFAWSLIQGYSRDIREWVRSSLEKEIQDLRHKQAKGRAGTRAAADRERRIASKERRQSRLDEIRRFTYSPTGDNREMSSLNHTEVIQLAASFLRERETFQRVVTSKYPVLLIDECQDTIRELLEALLVVEADRSDSFAVGLFGDMMQRIYGHGKPDLAASLPSTWARPAKRTNHRSRTRVVDLINRVRADDDGHEQIAREDKSGGFVRLFVLPDTTEDKRAAEASVARRMAEAAGDENWENASGGYKALTLEHHMAAGRLGFQSLFGPLYSVERLRTALLDGTLPPLRFLRERVLALAEALREGDEFRVAAIVRGSSPVVDREALRGEGVDQRARLQDAKAAVETFSRLWDGGAEPTLRQALHCIQNTGLFELPEALSGALVVDATPQSDAAETPDTDDDIDEATAAWCEVLSCALSDVALYGSYVDGCSPFDTHQGVKGLQFPRVMVIIDDAEARGFMFNYEKLFGVKEPSATDRKKLEEGAETAIDRTRRLFYVTCSRAEEALAIVAYTEHPEALRDQVLEREWFTEEEVEVVSSRNGSQSST